VLGVLIEFVDVREQDADRAPVVADHCGTHEELQSPSRVQATELDGMAGRATSLSRAVLRGWRCSDGRLLRFWFYFHKTTAFTGTEQTEQLARKEEPFANHHGPVSSAALASTGTFTVTARLSGLLDGSVCGGRYHHPANCVMQGYLMFSSPGKWVVQAQRGSKIVGTAVFDLRG
jgi:hypothetical protein